MGSFSGEFRVENPRNGARLAHLAQLLHAGIRGVARDGRHCHREGLLSRPAPLGSSGSHECLPGQGQRPQSCWGSVGMELPWHHHHEQTADR